MIALFIWDYIEGHRYFTVHKVGSLDLNFDFSGQIWYTGLSNLTKDEVLRCMERYYDYIQDEEDYRQLYQKVEGRDESTIFVMSFGAPIRYISYYDGDDLYCLPVYGKVQPCRLYIYRVNRRIPEIG